MTLIAGRQTKRDKRKLVMSSYNLYRYFVFDYVMMTQR